MSFKQKYLPDKRIGAFFEQIRNYAAGTLMSAGITPFI
jgi:hypothetical protein